MSQKTLSGKCKEYLRERTKLESLYGVLFPFLQRGAEIHVSWAEDPKWEGIDNIVCFYTCPIRHRGCCCVLTPFDLFYNFVEQESWVIRCEKFCGLVVDKGIEATLVEDEVALASENFECWVVVCDCEVSWDEIRTLRIFIIYPIPLHCPCLRVILFVVTYLFKCRSQAQVWLWVVFV